MVKGTNEGTLSQYHGVNVNAVERKVGQVERASQVQNVTKANAMRHSTYEIRVPNKQGGFDVYEHAADGTITPKP